MTQALAPLGPFAAPISYQIWDDKYRFQKGGEVQDKTVQDTWRRIADALAEAEDTPEKKKLWAGKFYDALEGFKYLPAGRITAGAGTGRAVTLFNCLAAETKIPTAEYGVVPISDIVGEFVHVIDGYGSWQLSKINGFGNQACASVHLKGGYNGREKRTVRATGGHRWIMQDGPEKITDNLNPGDVLKIVNRAPVKESADYHAGVAHGITYGDGTRRYDHADGSTSYCVRLCGEKTELFSYLEKAGWRHTQPPSFGDDILAVSSPTHLNLKSCPGEGFDVGYLTGFLHGWMATDGCVCERDNRAMISCGAYEADWLTRYGPIAGMEVAYKTKLGSATNYGTRNISIFNVSFKSWTLTPGDFLRTKHRENFGLNRNYPWVVEAIDPAGDPEPVFCPRVLTTDSVQLTDGIHTGQCFVMGTIPDSMGGIFTHLREAALTMQQGGGIGYDFSTLRPKNAPVKKLDADASGPLTFMDVWDAMCRTVMSAGSRRGAMMATMRCDHPDILEYIEVKKDPARLRMFNLSVLVTDDFMAALETGGEIELVHGGKKYGKVKAALIWDRIMESTYAQAEPGVIFIDRINRANNLNYCEQIASTNPCGEQPLPPYGACLLGSINLARLVESPFTDDAGIDQNQLKELVRVAVRAMDNVVDVSNFPLGEQKTEAKNKRRIGLGVTGLADALAMCQIEYGSDEAVERTEKWMKLIDEAAYRGSIELAKEKGAFPLFNAEAFLAEGTHASQHSLDIKQQIKDHGIRNALLTSIAPTGTISLYAGNVSSGIEPIFAYGYTRKVLEKDGSKREERVEDYAVAAYRDYWEDHVRIEVGKEFDPDRDLPDYFVSAQTLDPVAHVKMQAAAQKWVDSSISKTINCPEDITFDDFKDVYMMAWDSGCKGCTTYRPNDITGSVLSVDEKPKETIPADEITDMDQLADMAMVTDLPELDAVGLPEALAKAMEEAPDWAINAGIAEWANTARYTKGEEPLPDRPDELEGRTYRIKVGDQKSVYLTVNDMIEDNGETRPFEIFLRSGDTTHDEWMVAIARTVSAIMRRPYGARFVAEGFKRIHSPTTGGFMHGGGGYQPSILAAIGTKLLQHMDDKVIVGPLVPMDGILPVVPESSITPPRTKPTGPACAACGSFNIKHESGCSSCIDCGNSSCG